MIKKETIISDFDGLKLDVEMIIPDGEIIGIVQLAHGMAEHKERYEHFMTYLSQHGYVAVIHDHRGHGNSVRSKDDLGYFYTEDIKGIVDDLHQVTKFIKSQYPDKPFYLFSHSMGTLVTRNYIKLYDYEIDKLILCGPPTKNSLTGLGLLMARTSKLVKGDRHRSKFVDNAAFGPYNKPYNVKNGWVCKNEETLDKYNKDELCGFTFTNNGFINLFKLIDGAFATDGWVMKNPELPIMLIAGADDPVIQSHKKFYELSEFLNDRGYAHTCSKLYEDKRHEILNEKDNIEVYDDIMEFLSSTEKQKNPSAV